MIPGEDASHDAALLALQLKPLAKGSSPDEFSARVTYSIENHMPSLERPFANGTAISAWVVKQVPLEHGIEVRGMFNALRKPKAEEAGRAESVAPARRRSSLTVHSHVGGLPHAQQLCSGYPKCAPLVHSAPSRNSPALHHWPA